MDKNLIRKRMAALLACAMLLTGVAAFADEQPVLNDTAAVTEDVREAGEDAVDESTEGEAETADPATGDAEPGNSEDANPVGGETAGDEIADDEAANNETEGDGTEADETEGGETKDSETASGENEDAGSEADKPVPPPIKFGEAPKVEGVEGVDESADAENGIAPLFFHEHNHKFKEVKGNFNFTEYEYIDKDSHRSTLYYARFFACEECSDEQWIFIGAPSVTEQHEDADNDQICDKCKSQAEPVDVDTKEELECEHPNILWTPIEGDTVEYEDWYDEQIASGGVYNVTTDKFDPLRKDPDQNQRTGHIRYNLKGYEGHCNICGADVKKYEQESVVEPHSFVNGVCACGYRQPAKKATTEKKEEPIDTREHASELLRREISAFVAAGASVSFVNEQLAYSDAELAAVQAVADSFERALLLLAALGYGDEVDYMLENRGLRVSAEAAALIEQLKARPANPEALAAFPLTEVAVNGKTYDAITVSLILTGDTGIVTRSFTFYLDGGELFVVK